MSKIVEKLNQGGQTCRSSRWAKLKSKLSNLEVFDFFSKYDNDENGILLDVRTREEFRKGAIPGSICFDYLSKHLADDIDSLDPNKCYYVFCSSGRRSIRVAILLKNGGFPNVHNLETGLTDDDYKKLINAEKLKNA